MDYEYEHEIQRYIYEDIWFLIWFTRYHGLVVNGTMRFKVSTSCQQAVKNLAHDDFFDALNNFWQFESDDGLIHLCNTLWR